MNKMSDLKQTVLGKLQHLDGMLIENPEDVQTEAMLGIVTMGEECRPADRKDTLLDPDHAFWSDYMRTIDSGMDAEREVRYAIRLLREEDDFSLRQPTDAEVPGVYISVGDVEDDPDDPLAEYDLDIQQGARSHQLTLSVTTENGVYETTLYKK